MLDTEQIDEVVNAAAITTLKKVAMKRVTSSPTSNYDGEDALLITIVLPEKWEKLVDGKMALDTIVKIQQALSKAGELRSPIVEFATESELAQIGGH